MTQDGQDMPATNENAAAAPAASSDNAEQKLAEITTMPPSETPEVKMPGDVTAQAAANDGLEPHMQTDASNVDAAGLDLSATGKEATNLSDATKDEQGHSTTLASNAAEVLVPTQMTDMTPEHVPVLADVHMQIENPKLQEAAMNGHENGRPANDTSADAVQASAPLKSGTTYQDSASTVSMTAPVNGNGHQGATPAGTDAPGNVPAGQISEQAPDQAQTNGGRATENTVQTVQAPPESSIAHPDSDIEEGEELGSPPPPPPPRQASQQRQRSPSATTSSNRRGDRRSRSPNRERRPSPQRSTQKPAVNRDELFKVYIGGLPERTELADLEDCFSQFGEIGHVELKLGYAFIEFVTQEGAAEAIETYNEGHFLGKMIKVEASKSATTQQKSIDEGTCFTCGEHGHFAKYCPKDPRNANRPMRRGPPRDRSPPPFARDRRNFGDRDRERDRPYTPRDRDLPPRRDVGRDDTRRFPPRDDRREPDRRRERDWERERVRGGSRELERSRGVAGRPIEPHTRDSHRNLGLSQDPAAVRERELLDRQRDKERQLRRMAEMDPNFVPPPLASAGYPPRGAPSDASPFPPGPPPPAADLPYYPPPYGSQHVPPQYLPPGGLPMAAPYAIHPSIPGPSASPPLPQYAPRPDPRMPYGTAAPYPPPRPPFGRDDENGRPEPYYRSNGGPPPRDSQDGAYGRRDSASDRRDRYPGPPAPYGSTREDYPPRGDTSFPHRGEERRPYETNLPSGGPTPPFFYDRPNAGWNAPRDRDDRVGAGSPSFDNYGRPPPPTYGHGAPSEGQGYDGYRPPSGGRIGYEAHRDRR